MCLRITAKCYSVSNNFAEILALLCDTDHCGWEAKGGWVDFYRLTVLTRHERNAAAETKLKTGQSEKLKLNSRLECLGLI